MITLACLECRLALRISGEHDEMDYLVGMRSDWYPDRYPCARSGCTGKMTLTDTIASDELEHLEMHDLNAQEAFHALQGMGLPPERKCGLQEVQGALIGSTIRSLELKEIKGTNRCALYSLTLSDGQRIYLGSSPFGALVYRIAPHHSHVEALTK